MMGGIKVSFFMKPGDFGPHRMIIHKMIQKEDLSRNNEEGKDFQAVASTLITLSSVIAFSAQNDSPGDTGEHATDILESRLQTHTCTPFHVGNFHICSSVPSPFYETHCRFPSAKAHQ